MAAIAVLAHVPTLERGQLHHMASVHGESFERVSSCQRRQLRCVPDLQRCVFRDMPCVEHCLAPRRIHSSLLVLGSVPVSQLRMVGVLPRIELLVLGEVLS